MEAIQWITENIEAITAGAVAILTGLAILAKLTPTPKDDKLIAQLLEFLNLWPKKKDA